MCSMMRSTTLDELGAIYARHEKTPLAHATGATAEAATRRENDRSGAGRESREHGTERAEFSGHVLDDGRRLVACDKDDFFDVLRHYSSATISTPRTRAFQPVLSAAVAASSRILATVLAAR
jgi:hypothetical protein